MWHFLLFESACNNLLFLSHRSRSLFIVRQINKPAYYEETKSHDNCVALIIKTVGGLLLLIKTVEGGAVVVVIVL